MDFEDTDDLPPLQFFMFLVLEFVFVMVVLGVLFWLAKS